MRKIEGSPRFDGLQLMSLTASRRGMEEKLECVFAYVDSGAPQVLGSVTMSREMLHPSDQTKELFSRLAASLEADACRVLFNETQTPEEKKEGIHEPTGIADGEEEATQI
jgi:hypothetical protein